jgi:photosystem II stability/assembly factor-like uncharacterized protein
MKRSFKLAKHAMGMSFLLLTYFISACGTLEIRLERTAQIQDGTLATSRSTQPAVPSKTTGPSATPLPIPTGTTPPLPTWTPDLNPTVTSTSLPIPTFLPGDMITITQIKMVGTMTGWAVGRDGTSSADHILTTSDGGRTWRDVTPPETLSEEAIDTTYREASVYFLDVEHAWVIYRPAEIGDMVVLWSTSSRGFQWETSDPFNTAFHAINNLYFSDESHGWLMLETDAGMGHAWIELYRTSERAGEWELLIDPYSENSADLHYCCKTGMVFHGADTGLVTFGRGPMGGAFINWSKDGGLTWESHALPRPEGYLEDLGDENWGYRCESHSPILFSSELGKVALECWENVDRSDISSFIFTTLDGGTTWVPEPYPGGQILFLNEDIGWALSNNLYQTLDGGQTWMKLSRVNWEGQFSFINQQLGWAVARDREEFALVYTEDSGKKWDIIEPLVME